MTRRSKKTPPTNTLRVGMLGPWQGLDPWEAQDLSGVIVRNQCFETLYHRRGGRPQGDRRYLANDLQLETIGPDGKPRYTMRLAEDLRFSDGRLVTPDDVVDSLEHVAPLRAMAKITAAGGRRLQFTCYDSDALLEPQLAQIWSVIGRRSPKFWLGTGPYMMVEENKGEEGQVLVLERNPHWVPVARKPPAIERIVFSTFKTDASGQPTALREAIEAEEIDFTLVLPREVAKGLQGVRKIYQPGQSTAFLAFNCKRPWLDRPEARQALSAAIDPWAIARICHDNPAAFAARGLLPPAMAPTQRSLPKYGASVATAALEAIGDKPRSLRMLTVWGPRPYLPDPRRVAEGIARQIGSFGIEVVVEMSENPAAFFEALRRGEHDLILSGYIAETAEPVDFVTALLSSQRIPRRATPMAATTNLGYFSDPEMDRRLAMAARDSGALVRVDERFEEMRPLVPLMYGASVAVHSWRLQHFELDPRGIPSFADLALSD